MSFRWHVLSECPDEVACPIHGRNRPPSMMQPVTFDDSPDDRVRVVRFHPVDEADDVW